jgi:hypothetical protein
MNSSSRLLNLTALAGLAAALFSGCSRAEADPPPGIIPVTIERDGDRFYLTRGGEPFFIRGCSGFEFLDEAVAAGANTIRTWGINHLDGGRLLDKAHARGLAVVVGLWLEHERQGFDYNDAKRVKAQYDRLTQAVLEYKHHPAILAWGVGNEVEGGGADPIVWDAVDDIARFIKDVDPYRPTMAVLAGTAIDRIQAVKNRAPHIDILGVNVYGGYTVTSQRIREAGWVGPYAVTEFGIDGTWAGSSFKTEWGAAVEPPSGVKADIYDRRYRRLVSDTDRCVGAFAFKWGFVPKGTSTWYSLFHEKGEPNAVVDVMTYHWTGSWPEDRAPDVRSLILEGRKPEDNLRVRPGQMLEAEVEYLHAKAEQLDLRWEVLPEVRVIEHVQGSQPIDVAPREEKIEKTDRNRVRLAAPGEPGAFRLYFYAYSPTGRIGTANFPFYVEE